MAMGDLNAVAYGQASHLAVLLRTKALVLADFVTLRGRPPRFCAPKSAGGGTKALVALRRTELRRLCEHPRKQRRPAAGGACFLLRSNRPLVTQRSRARPYCDAPALDEALDLADPQGPSRLPLR
ncbi:hypothetical protein AK812_SmicGene44098 [Symbiodinium microadriaticum]|uniref:Uncharacterized protein n=1 Tax=Symbiodinium microadriaticum TaxID=2951 RepID=A0A1Q9BZC2_SYMMI|nr:hypothetical protein AK812_SmicGene44098 [Symbiodinium microadriaticum]